MKNLKPSELLSQPGAWCQGHSYRGANGEWCSMYQATSQCLLGAVWKILAVEKQAEAIRAIADALGTDMISDWNDAPDRTQDEVVALLQSVGL